MGGYEGLIPNWDYMNVTNGIPNYYTDASWGS